MGTAWSGARETGCGVLLDVKIFFKEQKYKAICQQPLPLGNLVLNHSIHEQRCLGSKNLTPLSAVSSVVPTDCMGAGRRGLVAGNQTLGEQGCWVVRAATFSSLVTGILFPRLGTRVLMIGCSFALALSCLHLLSFQRDENSEGNEQVRIPRAESGFEPKVPSLCLLVLGTDTSHLILNIWNGRIKDRE